MLARARSERPVIPQSREGLQNEGPPPCRPGPLTRRRVCWQAPGKTFSSLVENEVHEDFYENPGRHGPNEGENTARFKGPFEVASAAGVG
jgi:hypothetical protein